MYQFNLPIPIKHGHLKESNTFDLLNNMTSIDSQTAFSQMLRLVEYCQQITIEMGGLEHKYPGHYTVEAKVYGDTIHSNPITNQAEWSALGKAIGRSTSCSSFTIVENRKYPHDSHLRYLFEGLKENKRICFLTICYSRDGPMFDLDYFLKHHTGTTVHFVALAYPEQLTREQMDLIISSIENNQQKLSAVTFRYLRLELDQEMFQRFLSTITSINYVEMCCSSNEQLDEVLNHLGNEMSNPSFLNITMEYCSSDNEWEETLTRSVCNFFTNN